MVARQENTLVKAGSRGTIYAKNLENFITFWKLEKALGTRLRSSCSRHMRPYLETFSTKSSRFRNSFPFRVFLFSVYTYFLEVFLTDSHIAMTLTAINWCCRGRFEIFYSKKKTLHIFYFSASNCFPPKRWIGDCPAYVITWKRTPLTHACLRLITTFTISVISCTARWDVNTLWLLLMRRLLPSLHVGSTPQSLSVEQSKLSYKMVVMVLWPLADAVSPISRALVLGQEDLRL